MIGRLEAAGETWDEVSVRGGQADAGRTRPCAPESSRGMCSRESWTRRCGEVDPGPGADVEASFRGSVSAKGCLAANGLGGT